MPRLNRVYDVLDGYTESLKIRGQVVLFRRMLNDERRVMFHRAGQMPNDQALWFLEELVYSRIVWGDIDFSSLSRADGERILKIVTGAGSSSREKADVENLFHGTVLEQRYPWLAKTPCDFCRKWWWSPLTNVVARDGIDGPPLERDPGQTLLCADGMCPKGTPENSRCLSPKNRMAYRHFRQCEASSFPDDPIVRRNAEVIRAALKKAGNVHQPSK